MNSKFKKPKFKDGETIKGWNLTQLNPHTKICEGVKGLTFIDCNLMNCDIPEDAKVVDCLQVHKSFCSHEHPKWVKKGLKECSENCEHFIQEKDRVEEYGETKAYKDKVVWLKSNLK